MPEMNAATPQNAALAAQRERQRTDTPEEARIRRQIFDIPHSVKARETVSQLHVSEERFLRLTLAHPGTNQKQSYDQHVADLADIMGETILEGVENLEALKGKPVIIVANHFGVTKFTLIDNHEKDGHRPIDVPVDEIQTFSARAAMFARVAQALDAPLRETAIELPGVLGQAQKDCGVIIIPAAGEGRTQKLADDVKQTVADYGNPTIIVYPEGGTSGKKSGMGPYHLEDFSTGAFVVAAQTGIPIMPTCTVFNGETGQFELYILPPIQLTPQDLQIEGRIAEVTQQTQQRMQQILNKVTGQGN